MKTLMLLLFVSLGLTGCQSAFYVKHCWGPDVCTTVKSNREYAEGFCFQHEQPDGTSTSFCPNAGVTNGPDPWADVAREALKKVPDPGL